MDESARKNGGYLGNPTEYTPKLYDMSGHWLTSQGWLDAALYSGMVVPDDYNGKNFRPRRRLPGMRLR